MRKPTHYLLLTSLLFGCLNILNAQIDFTASVQRGCSPQVITFTPNAPGATAYEWDLGNGASSTAASPGVTYINPGFYTVRLRAIYPGGNFLEVIKTNYIEIFNNPIADFQANPLQICEGESIQFLDQSQPGSNPLTSWLWDFGDGDTASTQDVNHSYTAAGTYTVTLIVGDAQGCEGTEQKQAFIQVNPRPDASFIADNALGCNAPFPVNFFSTGSGSAFTHTWDLGNGQTSMQVNPSTTYGNGIFDVTHIVSSPQGCADTVVRNGLINVGNVQVNIQVSDSIACVGEQISFFCGGGFGSIVSWDFGVPGGTSTDCNAVWTYRTPGLYTVNATILDPSGCTFQSSQQIRVSVPPVPDFSTLDTLFCDPPFAASFTNNSTGATSYLWEFGDGSTSTAANPTHTYPVLPVSSSTGQPYIYDVRLTAFNADGCLATVIQRNRIITGQTQAAFSAHPFEGCVPLTVNFADTTLTTSTVNSWVWDFGDGTTSTLAMPTHTYVDTGIFTVSLIVGTVHGCRDTLIRGAAVKVGEPPVADFVANRLQTCASSAIEFTNLSTGADSAFWIFGDGLTSRDYDAVHVFRDTGLMDVTLIAYNNGCPNVLTRPQYIDVLSPVAAFSMPTMGCVLPFTISPSNETIDAHRYLWDFGDGTTSTDTLPSHTYTQEGTYIVKLYAFNDTTGCVDSVLLPLNIELIDPVLDFQSIGTCNPIIVQFADLTPNSIATTWYFGDGDSSFLRNPVHVYTDPGSYQVDMIVSNQAGCRDVRSVVIPVSEPIVDFQAIPSANGCVPYTVTFNNLTNSPSPVNNWQWTFGPAGATSTDPNPTFTYQTPGSYTVSLIATDTLGCTDTLTRRNYVSVFQAIARFSIDEPINCINNPITFFNTSAGSGLSYFWDFGDGNTSTVTNPIHSYVANGMYDVSLTVTDFNGCDSTLTLPVTIADPMISLSADTTFADCPPLLVNFTATPLSPHTFTDWSWDFGDGASSTGINPSHLYITSGDFDISLIGTTSAGCVANIIEPDFIQISGPEAAFSFSPGSGCPGEPISFTSQNVFNVDRFIWDFGNGVLDSGANVVYAYPDSGIYYPILLAEDAGGCQVVLPSPDSILIYPKPTANFQISAGQLCGGDTLTFTDLSTSDNPILAWEWDFGFTRSTQQNPTIIFSSPGIYDISLIVTNQSGCRDTLIQPAGVIVEPNIQPTAPEIRYVSVLSDSEIEIVYEEFPNTFDDFEEYVIYREDGVGNFIPIQRINNLQTTRIVDRGLNTRGGSYCYKLQVLNECGLASDVNGANTHCSILLETTEALGQISINWSEYIGWPAIEEYRLYEVQNYGTGNVQLLATLPPTVRSFVDVDVFCTNEKTYRVQAIRSNDSIISWSNIQVEAPLHEAPSEPINLCLATVLADTFIQLQWNPLSDVPFADELIIEKDAGNGFFPVYSQPASDPNLTWTDEMVRVDERSYAYRAYVRDSCGEQTPIGRIGRSILLQADRQVGNISLNWNTYEAWEMGIQNYRLEVFNELNQAYEPVALIGPNLIEYLDRSTDLPQREFCYRIFADENGGKELSSLSNTACVPVGPQIFYPNAFTPNGDQINDRFIIVGLFIEDANLKIFSRWGELIFETDDIDAGWDGRYKGKIVPEGVYVFRVEGMGYEGSQFAKAGTVTLIR